MFSFSSITSIGSSISNYIRPNSVAAESPCREPSRFHSALSAIEARSHLIGPGLIGVGALVAYLFRERLVRFSPSLLSVIPQSLQTQEMADLAVQSNPLYIQFVRQDLRTQARADLAVQSDPSNFCLVREDLQTQEMAYLAVQSNPYNICLVRLDLQTQDMADLAVRSNPFNFRWVRQDLQTQEMADLAVRSDPFNFRWVRQDLQTQEMADLAVQYPNFSWENFEIARDEFIHHPDNILLNLYKRILADARVPSITFIEENGLDAGGLTRQFFNLLFKSIEGNPTLFPIQQDDEGLWLQKKEGQPIELLKAIGAIFGAALVIKSFTVGTCFHKNIFNTLYALNQDAIQSIPEDFESLDQLDPESSLYETLINNIVPKYFGETLEDKQRSFDYGYKERIIATAIIAKSMHAFITASGNQWDRLKTSSSDELTIAIQGSIVNKDLLAASINCEDENIKHWIENWILDQGTSQDLLVKFVEALSGSRTLRKDLKFNIVRKGDRTELPQFFFHQCANSVDISMRDDTTKEDLIAALIADIGKTCGYNQS
ncbi:MAG: hypothetical protein ACOYK9_02105 [Chlamydiia bacterium]